MFLDEAVVEFQSGRGGSGAVGFHREKHVPRGGPNGADGGRGGSIILVADRNRRTLYDFKLAQRFIAENGVHGVGNKRGKDAKDVILKVPVGTVVTNAETGEQLVDLNQNGMKFTLCEGGKGGKGNQHYTNSVRQAPNFAQKGAPGERIVARLELKLLADVALVGLPNAGKSTLISRISAAKPKIADYPFTTIIPNLGVVWHRNDSFVVADLPGLIEGASRGVGLGHQFLRHVERCRILVHVVEVSPVDESDPIANYQLIENELRLYSEEIWSRPRVIALSKCDTVSPEIADNVVRRLAEFGPPVYPISSATGQGLEPLLDEVQNLLKEHAPTEAEEVVNLLPSTNDELNWDVESIGENAYRVNGKRIERMVAMTDVDNDEALRYLHRRLERIGIYNRLREIGAQDGDEVWVGDQSFEFSDAA